MEKYKKLLNDLFFDNCIIDGFDMSGKDYPMYENEFYIRGSWLFINIYSGRYKVLWEHEFTRGVWLCELNNGNVVAEHFKIIDKFVKQYGKEICLELNKKRGNNGR